MSVLRRAAIALALALVFAPAAHAGVPQFCYDYNDDDHDMYVYGLTGALCPRDDCNDRDATIHPGAAEICGDTIDQDCDGSDLPCPGADDDRDGFLAMSAGGTDCDDTDPAVHPGVTEVCGDGKDNDCAGGDPPCALDADHDGYSAASAGGNDCDDGNAGIHPHAGEVCGDGIDQDCAGGDPACEMDTDGDGHVNAAMGGDDCDDYDRSSHPGAIDTCGDGRDQDCSGADEACAPKDADNDHDGHPAAGSGGDDCNDGDPAIYAGAAEICGDMIDQDCNGVDLSCTASTGDADGDGFASIEAGGDDCNDSDAAIHPGAIEICGDGRDQNCDASDAIPGVSPECLGLATTNPAFDGVRDRGPRLETPESKSPLSCVAAGDPGGLALLALLMPWIFGRRRR